MRPESKRMSPALANRSFLYHGSGAHAATTTAAATVYATLDSLALKRASLPLKLLPVDERLSSIDKPDISSVSKSISDVTAASTPESTLPPNSLETDASFSSSASDIFPTHYNDASPSPPKLPENNRNYSSLFKKKQQQQQQTRALKKALNDSSADNQSKKERREFTFAKNVLHYVPITSRRYYRKSRKLASKSLSLKSLAGGADKCPEPPSSRTLKTRSLSRDELKYVSISTPSNFVHVASATRRELLAAEEPDRPTPLITHRGKYADLRGGDYYAEVATLVQGARELELNDSFLWRSLSRARKEVEQQPNGPSDDADYDDVGPPRVAQPVFDQESAGCKKPEEQVEPEQDAYDDVGPGLAAAAADDEQVYDDVMPLAQTTFEEEVAARLDLRETPVDEEEEELQPDEDVYDDVGLPTLSVQQRSQQLFISLESHERVNSLYAGSSASGSIQLALSAYNDKESEWEDLDDSAIYGNVAGRKAGISESAGASPSKRRSGQRWSRKVRRQRSKASRKSSGRSSSRSRSQQQQQRSGSEPGSARTYSVAVSLGAGTVLLLGNSDEPPCRREEKPPDDDVRGLVQLRFILVEEDGDVQETSLYVAEDSSDDSNYETLETYEPDDFSSDSDGETTTGSSDRPSTKNNNNHTNNNNNSNNNNNLPTKRNSQPGLLHLSLREPPSRPIPPPPREASLGHALGLRMKMLRRTWSITKGSLGRMRRRASGDGEAEASAATAAATTDARKYFSFKKHFRKSQSQAGLSTFYLDKTGQKEEERQEPIYTNGDWYQEAGLYRSEDCGKEETVIDHYSVLAEEPLYQFYAADATRVAFESDSDGYEEVEELTPSAATTDLARPGHRTLWCQTPQVINSGLLHSLTMEERKIQEAKFEILTSEASYLNSLRVLENEFASNYELTQEILASTEREKLFGSVPEVLVTSERFLAELESIWREDPMLGKLPELLLKHGERSANVYVDYCSNQVSIDTTLKELKAKKGYKFLETVSRIEMRPACHSLSLHSFLMLPMQRITRLPLLADAVLSKLSVEHSERLSWERVLAALSQIVAKCNEAARLAERRNEMEALARKLEYSTKVPPISLQDRELIRSGTVVHLSSKSDTEYKLTFGKKFHKTPLMLMLLTDYLLVTKLKSNSNEETYSVIETCKRSMVALEAVPEDSPFAGRHAMVLTLLENHLGRQVEYVLTCDNDTEKERWLDAVSPPKPSCVGETLYESWDCPQVMALYSYAPRQPDELALQPGDVINVLRKMNDGWLYGEKLLDGEQGWFPGNFTKEVASEHVRARNLRQRHRFLALSGSVLQRRAKQSLSLL